MAEKVTTVSEYRNQAGRERIVTAPSGAKFKIKSLSPVVYLEEGLADIPNEFFKFLGELASGKTPDQETDKKNYEMFEKFVRIAIEKGIVDPPVLYKYDQAKKDTHLVFGELEQQDQAFLLEAIKGKK